jgi:hypothetical protein
MHMYIAVAIGLERSGPGARMAGRNKCAGQRIVGHVDAPANQRLQNSDTPAAVLLTFFLAGTTERRT